MNERNRFAVSFKEYATKCNDFQNNKIILYCADSNALHLVANPLNDVFACFRIIILCGLLFSKTFAPACLYKPLRESRILKFFVAKPAFAAKK